MEAFEFASNRSPAGGGTMDAQLSTRCNEEHVQQVLKLIRCNEALRALVRLQQSFSTGPSTCCHCLSQLHCSSSDKNGIPAKSDIDKSAEKAMAEQSAEISGQHDGMIDLKIRNQRLIKAIRLLKDDLDAERDLTARLKKNQFRADVVRFFLFAAGVCAVIVLYPRY